MSMHADVAIVQEHSLTKTKVVVLKQVRSQIQTGEQERVQEQDDDAACPEQDVQILGLEYHEQDDDQEGG